MTQTPLLSALISLAMTMSAFADERPNIVFCFSDDWGRYASIYRDRARPGLNDVINTPALDAIGRSGVVFNNAFVKRRGGSGLREGASPTDTRQDFLGELGLQLAKSGGAQ